MNIGPRPDGARHLGAPGTRIGPYEVISPLGRGGMGTVLLHSGNALARDLALEQIEAACQDASGDARDDVRTYWAFGGLGGDARFEHAVAGEGPR